MKKKPVAKVQRPAALAVDLRFDLASRSDAVVLTAVDRRAFRRAIQSALRAAARGLLAPGLRAEVDVLVVDDGAIRELNARHRGIDRATDALSFPQRTPDEARSLWTAEPPACFLGQSARPRTHSGRKRAIPAPPDPPGAPVALGDIVVSLPGILRQARRRRATAQSELQFVAVHSLLHLLGCDHDTPARRRSMWTLAQSLLRGTKTR